MGLKEVLLKGGAKSKISEWEAAIADAKAGGDRARLESIRAEISEALKYAFGPDAKEMAELEGNILTAIGGLGGAKPAAPPAPAAPAEEKPAAGYPPEIEKRAPVAPTKEVTDLIAQARETKSASPITLAFANCTGRLKLMEGSSTTDPKVQALKDDLEAIRSLVMEFSATPGVPSEERQKAMRFNPQLSRLINMLAYQPKVGRM